MKPAEQVGFWASFRTKHIIPTVSFARTGRKYPARLYEDDEQVNFPVKQGGTGNAEAKHPSLLGPGYRQVHLFHRFQIEMIWLASFEQRALDVLRQKCERRMLRS
ncbi:MAG: hypothetical protein WA954_10880 [Parerythrobacter sp.]